MPKKIILVALVLVIVLAGWLAYYFSDKEVIKRQLNGLAVQLGKEGQETPVQMALKMRDVKDMLAARCLVTIPDRGYGQALEQELIIRYLIYHRTRYTFIAVIFEDVDVDIPDTGQASVQATVRLSRKISNGAEAAEEVQQVELGLEKGDKRWLLKAVTMPAVLVE